MEIFIRCFKCPYDISQLNGSKRVLFHQYGTLKIYILTRDRENYLLADWELMGTYIIFSCNERNRLISLFSIENVSFTDPIIELDSDIEEESRVENIIFEESEIEKKNFIKSDMG